MTKIRLMTWNVLYSERADNILALVKALKPDILCCQEITVESHLNPNRNVPAELAKLLGGSYVYKQILSEMYNSMPPERREQYLASAEAAVDEAAEPVIDMMARIAVFDLIGPQPKVWSMVIAEAENAKWQAVEGAKLVEETEAYLAMDRVQRALYDGVRYAKPTDSPGAFVKTKYGYKL